jgi:hypothetical protein
MTFVGGVRDSESANRWVNRVTTKGYLVYNVRLIKHRM